MKVDEIIVPVDLTRGMIRAIMAGLGYALTFAESIPPPKSLAIHGKELYHLMGDENGPADESLHLEAGSTMLLTIQGGLKMILQGMDSGRVSGDWSEFGIERSDVVSMEEAIRQTLKDNGYSFIKSEAEMQQSATSQPSNRKNFEVAGNTTLH